MAEALGKKLASDAFESYSADTETKPRINPNAVRLMRQVHGIDMEAVRHRKQKAYDLNETQDWKILFSNPASFFCCKPLFICPAESCKSPLWQTPVW